MIVRVVGHKIVNNMLTIMGNCVYLPSCIKKKKKKRLEGNSPQWKQKLSPVAGGSPPTYFHIISVFINFLPQIHIAFIIRKE